MIKEKLKTKRTFTNKNTPNPNNNSLIRIFKQLKGLKETKEFRVVKKFIKLKDFIKVTSKLRKCKTKQFNKLLKSLNILRRC